MASAMKKMQKICRFGVAITALSA